MADSPQDKKVDETTDQEPVYEDFNEHDLVCECYAKDEEIKHLNWKIKVQAAVIESYMNEVDELQRQLTGEESWTPYG